MDRKGELEGGHYLFTSRLTKSPHVSTRQYARIVHQWVAAIGLDSTVYGTHSMRRTKAALIYKRTKNLRAVQLLLGHTKLESTVRYLGIKVDDALEISEQTEIQQLYCRLHADSMKSFVWPFSGMMPIAACIDHYQKHFSAKHVCFHMHALLLQQQPPTRFPESKSASPGTLIN